MLHDYCHSLNNSRVMTVFVASSLMLMLHNGYFYFLRVFDSTVHVVDPLSTVGLQPSEDSSDNKKVSRYI